MDVITRLAMFIVAFLLAVDAFSAERSESMRVERHVRISRWQRGDDYRLDFTGGRVESCAVGRSAFNALGDGDVVSVDTSRVFKSCGGIRRGDAVISQARPHHWLLLVPIAILLAAAFDWIQFDRRAGGEARRGGGWFS
jgi:hypothetical protein